MNNTTETMQKMIRFINSDYLELFQVPDGGNIVITRYDGEKVTAPCKFIDETHTRIGREIYHICQFAELMERNGNKYEPEIQIKNLELAVPETKEMVGNFKLADIKDRLLGFYSGSFRRSDGRYFCSMSGFENAKSTEGRNETAQIMYALKNGFFQHSEMMRKHCTEPISDNTAINLFRTRTKKYDYYVKCVSGEDSDDRFFVYCCEKERKRIKTAVPKVRNNESR